MWIRLSHFLFIWECLHICVVWFELVSCLVSFLSFYRTFKVWLLMLNWSFFFALFCILFLERSSNIVFCFTILIQWSSLGFFFFLVCAWLLLLWRHWIRLRSFFYYVSQYFSFRFCVGNIFFSQNFASRENNSIFFVPSWKKIFIVVNKWGVQFYLEVSWEKFFLMHFVSTVVVTHI